MATILDKSTFRIFLGVFELFWFEFHIAQLRVRQLNQTLDQTSILL